MLFKLKRTGHNEDDVSLWQRTTVRNIFWIILWRRKQNLIDSLDKTKLLCSCKHSGLIAIFWIYPASPISSERQQGINHVVNKIAKLITWVKNFSLYFASKTGSTVTPSTLAGVWQNKKEWNNQRADATTTLPQIKSPDNSTIINWKT